MNKSRVCTFFPNCNKLQEKFTVPLPTLYSYIRIYNDYARRNGIELIRPNISYTEEQLTDIGNKISEYRLRRIKDPKFDKKERKSLAKSFGSFESYAISIVQSTLLTGNDVEMLRNEIAQEFVDKLISASHQIGLSPEDTIKKYGVQSIFNGIRNSFNAKIRDSFNELQNAEALNLSEKRKEQLRDIINIGQKFLPLGNPNGTDAFNELCILSLSLINSVFDIKIQSDMTVSGQDIQNFEDALIITDEEKPIRERWQQSLDEKPAEGSVSSIVKRILLNTPKIELVPTTKYYIDGKEVTNLDSLTEEELLKVTPKTTVSRQVVTGKILGKPLFSNPAQEARRLFRILENVTTETELLDVLKNQEQYKNLVDYLEENPRERTTFLADFNKYFQELSAVILVNKGDGTYEIKSPTLNIGSRNTSIRDYYGDLTYGNISDNSFYTINKIIVKNDDGSESISRKVRVGVDYKKFVVERKSFDKNFIDKDGVKSTFTQMLEAKKYEAASNLLIAALDVLNIRIDITVANDLIANDSTRNILLSNISEFYTKGEEILWKNKGNVIESFRNNDALENALYKILKITNPSDVMSSASTNMVSFDDGKISSRILPSAITNFIKKLHKFDYRDKEERQKKQDYVQEYIQNWLERTYLNGDQFMNKDGVILNRWLKDLYDSAAAQSGTGSIRDYFGLSRSLGIDNVKFERISNRAHMLSFLFSYFGNRKYNIGEEIPAKLGKNGEILLYNEETKEFDIPAVNTKNKTFAIVDSIKTIRFDRNNHKEEGFRQDAAMIPLFITGDTNQLRLFRTMHYHESEIVDGMYNMYLSDLVTQGVIKGFDDKGIVVSGNNKETLTKKGNNSKFGILDFLNNPKYRKLLDEKAIDGVVSKEDFIEIAQQHLEDEFNEFYDTQLVNLGLLDKTADDKYVYFDDFLDTLTKQDKEAKLKEILRDFYFNYKFGLYNQIQLNHVTTLSFNGVEDTQKRNKVVGTNGTPLSSEAEINGQRLFPKGNFAQRVVYFQDVLSPMAEDTADALKKFLTKQYEATYGHDKAVKMAEKFVSMFDENTLTDGEAYRGLASYRAILASAGKNFWSDKHEQVYQKIVEITSSIRQENRNATVEEIQEIEDLLTALQPIKPVNDGIETYLSGDTCVKMGFQFKYAEVPLIPELYPIGSKLRQMGEWMQTNGIDMVCSNKCLKKGSFGEIDIQYKAVNGQYIDSDGNVLPGCDMNGKLVDNPTMAQQRRYITLNKKDNRVPYGDDASFEDVISGQSTKMEDGSFTGFTVHNIPLDNYLIQNNVPDHSGGKVIVGTQARKIIGSAIKNDRTYHIKVGKKTIDIKGDKLFEMYNALHTAKYMKSFVKFMSMMNDKKTLSRNLAYSISSNGRSNINLLERIAFDNDGNPMIPYSEVSNERDLMNTIISLFKRTVIRQQIAGGNIVQASSLGVGKKALQDPDLYAIRDDSGNITGMEAETPFFFAITSEDGAQIPLKYEDFCNDDGTFKPGENGGETLIEEKYPGILDLVMYRIPTEGLYSMYHVHIKRVTPKTSANTIKLPVECTSISDFDFDIDKLMFMMRNFVSIPEKVVHIEGGLDSVIWKQIYDEHSVDIYWPLKKAAEDTGWDNFIKTGDRSKLTQDVLDLAKERGVDVKDLRLNHFWGLAEIKQSKQSIYDEYSQQFVKEAHVEGSTFDFNEDTDLLSLSTSAIDNAIIDISEAVMSDESTLEERLTPGGFKTMSNDARLLRLLQHPETVPGWENRKIETEQDFNEFLRDADNSDVDFKIERDYSDPMTAILFKQQNQVAGEEIGIFANDNINEAISRRLKTFKISNPKDAILFASLIDRNVDFTGKEPRELIGQSFLFDSVNGRLIRKTLEEMLGSSVDAVKDNALIDINLNAITGDLGAMLARLGYSTFDIGLLFNQPIIKELCQEMALSGERNVTKVLRRVVRRYSKDPKILSRKINKESVTSISLAKNLINGGDIVTQINVAKLFNQICLIKQDVSKYVQKTRNTSANTVKVDIGKFLSNFEKNEGSEYTKITIEANDNLKDPITNEALEERWFDLPQKELIEKLKSFMVKYKDHPFTYENAVYNLINAAMFHILKKYTPYLSNEYNVYRDILSKYMSPWGLSGDYINELHNFVPALQLVSYDGDFNPNSTNNPLGITNKEYYLKRIFDLIGEVAEINPQIIEKNQFLSAFNAQRVKENNDDSMVLKFKYPRNLEPFEKYGFTMAWDELMKMGGKFAELGKALYLHNYYVNGFNNNTNPLMEIAPVSVLDSLVADATNGMSYLDIYLQNDNIVPEDVARARMIQFMLYHAKDDKIVPSMPWHLKDLTLDGNSIIISNDKLEDVKMALCGKFAYYIRPIIKVDGAIYVLSEKSDNAEYEIGDVIYNVISTKTQTATYVRLKQDKVEYSEYITGNNGYIFGDIKESVEEQSPSGEEETRAEEDSSNDDVADAVKEAEAAPEKPDSTGVLGC